jgi:transcriptional regulator with XRE-family HTH domain
MKNKNIHTMKQPELGKRISELRKEKGLTQEELVEQCNINVRTIQRIEAGEVNPRSYTIKTILNVLGADYFEDKQEQKIILNSNERSKLNLAWVFGIVYFIIGFIETTADFYQFTGDDSILSTSFYIVVKGVSAISFVLFFNGFYTIGKVYDNQLLKIVTLFLMSLFVISNCIDVFSMHLLDETIAIRIIIECIVFGILQLIFGIGIYQLKDKIGQLAQITGILEIIVGASIATVIFASLGVFLLIPAVLIEVILLYRLARK